MTTESELGKDQGIDPEKEEAISAGFQSLVQGMIETSAGYDGSFDFSPDADQLATIRFAVENALATIGQRDARALTLRNGLDGELPMTLDQVAMNLGPNPVTRERARQIEQRAMRKLRQPVMGVGKVIEATLGVDPFPSWRQRHPEA